MKNFASDEEKFDFVFDNIQQLTDSVVENGAYCFDVAIEEKKIGNMQTYKGKAFSVDGTNLFGFTYDNDYDSTQEIPESINTAIFAGSFVEGKGVSIDFLPYFYINLKSPTTDFTMNVTNRPGKRNLYGKRRYDHVKMSLTPYAGEDLEKIVSFYVDLFAQITNEYLDKAVIVTEKAESQDENIALINKLYEQFKGIPIPSCFTEDGAVPKTKI